MRQLCRDNKALLHDNYKVASWHSLLKAYVVAEAAVVKTLISFLHVTDTLTKSFLNSVLMKHFRTSKMSQTLVSPSSSLKSDSLKMNQRIKSYVLRDQRNSDSLFIGVVWR